MRNKRKVPRFKLQRRLMVELPGLGKPGSLERKPYPPGQHGMQRIKYSEYRLQLEEKQKIRIHYDLREEQLLRLVKSAKRNRAGVWVDVLVNSLERRLQNVIFRAGLAPSQMSAGQMISHGQVLVNGRKVDIRSAIIKKGDVVELTAKGLKNQIYVQSKTAPRLPLPEWIEKFETMDSVKVRLIDEPTIEAVPFPFEKAYFTSFYSKVS
ncbi:MAG: 30S ribosomal protein S4 [Bdellovibrio sp.]